MATIRWKGCVILLALNTYLVAQSFQIDPQILYDSQNGPRASAMGGAYTAIANDATALTWNPAGLPQIKETRSFISSSLVFGDLEITPPQQGVNNKTYRASRAGSFSLDYIGFIIPLPLEKTNVVSSVAVRNLADLNDEYTISTLDNGTSSSVDSTFKSRGGLFALSAGLGVEVIKDLSLGTCLNFISGKKDFRRQENTVVIENWTNWENKFSGFSIDFGVFWQASNILRLGSKMTFPHKINFTDVSYTDSDNNKRELTADIYLKQPISFSYGLALQPANNLILSFDFNQRPWRKVIINMEDNENDRVYENAHSFHIGAEYTLVGKNYLLPWRIGFYSKPEQIFDYAASEENKKGEQVSSHFITGGLGLNTKKAHFGLSVNYQVLQYRSDFAIPLSPFDVKDSKIRVNFGLEIFI
jgi:hypothetical protein